MVKLTEMDICKNPILLLDATPTFNRNEILCHQLMKEKEFSVTEEVELKEKVLDYRVNSKDFLRNW